MKKIINWLKKRTASKLLIVLFAACTVGFLVVGKWGPALIEFAFFISWVALDKKSNTIEVQDKTINLLMRDNKQLQGKLDLEGASMMLVFAQYLKYKAIADLCQRKIDLSTYLKNRQDADFAMESAEIVIDIVQRPDFHKQEKPQGE